MAFSSFSLRTFKEQFGIAEKKADLFPCLISVTPSAWLEESLSMSLQLPLNSEKAKSEFLISPILLEVWKQCNKNFTIFSGANLDINNTLSGECDFILSATPESQEIEAPIFMLIEAKDGNLRNGYGQCLAQMYAACLFNQVHRQTTPTIFGAVTTGEDWQFLKLEDNTIYFHQQRFYISQKELILGALVYIVNFYKK